MEISSAVWKLASGEFYFKKKKAASEKMEPESKQHGHERVTLDSSGRAGAGVEALRSWFCDFISVECSAACLL